MDTKGCICSQLFSPPCLRLRRLSPRGLSALELTIPAYQKDMRRMKRSITDGSRSSKTWAPGLVTPCSWPMVCIFKMVRLSFQMQYTYLHYLQESVGLTDHQHSRSSSIAVTIASFEKQLLGKFKRGELSDVCEYGFLLGHVR